MKKALVGILFGLIFLFSETTFLYHKFCLHAFCYGD